MLKSTRSYIDSQFLLADKRTQFLNLVFALQFLKFFNNLNGLNIEVIMQISNLVRTTPFWEKNPRVRWKSKDLRANNSESFCFDYFMQSANCLSNEGSSIYKFKAVIGPYSNEQLSLINDVQKVAVVIINISLLSVILCINYLVHMTRFQNNLHHVHSRSKDWKAKLLKTFVNRNTKGSKQPEGRLSQF